MGSITTTAEYIRLQEDKVKSKYWRKWGSYLAERQWGTVREDYSATGDAWNYFTHHQSRYRTYRWGEDGIAGISDNHQRLCFSIALWNGRDRILKERLYGLSNIEGNHGEDVKEEYFYLDNTPTHSYMKMLYKYPQQAFPYDLLRDENLKRSKNQPEFEIADTGIFDNNEYFDVYTEYAKVDDDDIIIRISIINKASTEASLTLLGQLWFRNTWRWREEDDNKPKLSLDGYTVKASHPDLADYYLYTTADDYIFTDNETNSQVLYNDPNRTKYTKEGFHRYLINDLIDSVNPEKEGTKSAAVFKLEFEAGQKQILYLRLSANQLTQPFDGLEAVMEKRIEEANKFYNNFLSSDVELARIQRQAFAGMLWNKQFYHYIVRDWLNGDPTEISPPSNRKQGRNSDWPHFYAEDILSMPDCWEYPWFASWDIAFHLIPMVMIDPEFAKNQLLLFTREWYIHPNGNIPAFEWNFDDTDPPIQAYSAWKIYKIEEEIYGIKDYLFLERVFHKLLLNFTWWVNRKDSDGNNIFSGGFLGLDNIGVFDRSHPINDTQSLDQADATSWMAMYSLRMMRIALELAQTDMAYEDIASKFFEHYIQISYAMETIGRDNHHHGLWDNDDMFFYDMLHLKSGKIIPLKIRSIVGLIPLFAVEAIESSLLEQVPDFNKRMHWYITHRPELAKGVICENSHGNYHRHLFSLVQQHQLQPIFKRLLDPEEFLSDYGIRSLSKWHENYPYLFHQKSISYEPAETSSNILGGNSNWRGPIWFPINYMLVESLSEFSKYYGNDLRINYPTPTQNSYSLDIIAHSIRQRLISIFQLSSTDERPVFGDPNNIHHSPDWKDNLLFYEYFNGETGEGLGASHQTGWTGLIAEIIYRMRKLS